MNWYIGQKIIAIRDHTQRLFKKDDIFTIQGIKKGCKHHPIILDIGLAINQPTGCFRCLKEYGFNRKEEESYFGSSSFRPLEQMEGDISELTKILEEPIIVNI